MANVLRDPVVNSLEVQGMHYSSEISIRIQTIKLRISGFKLDEFVIHE